MGQGKSERKHNFKLLQQSYDNFNSQTGSVFSSMEFVTSSQNLRTNNSTVMLRSKNQTARAKSNFSQGKLTNAAN